MKTLLIGSSARARLWLSDLPDCHYAALSTIEHSLPVEGAASPQLWRAAIEVFIPYGPMAHYGLLGAEITAQASSDLLVRIGISSAVGPPLARSLATSDDVRVGLPDEYAQSVRDGVVQSPEARHLGGGMLEFSHAAHGLVGSAPVVFRNLATALVAILAKGGQIVSREALSALLLSTR